MKKLGLIRLLLAAVMVFSTACTKKEAGSAAVGGVAEGYTQPVELTFYSNAGITEDQFNQQFGDYLKQKMPNVTVKFIPKDKSVSISDMIASGSTKIDIFIDSIGQIGLKGSLIDLGLNQDISDLVKKHGVDLNRFDPTTIDAVKTMGGLYGLPISNSTLVLMYNKDIFDKFGVPYPKDGMTWDDLSGLAKKLTRSYGGQLYIGDSTSMNHFLRMNPLSLANVDPQTKQANLTTEKWKQLLQETVLNPMQGDVYTAEVANLSKMWYKIPYQDEFFKTQNVAMFSFLYGDYAGLQTMNYDFAALPTFKENPGVGSQSYPTYMFITSNSEHKDAAMEVIKQFISDDYQTQMSKNGGITTLKSEAIRNLFGTDTKMKDKNIKNAVFHNRPAPAAPKTKYDTYVEGAILGQIPDLITGKTDLNTALRTAQDSVDQKIASDNQ